MNTRLLIVDDDEEIRSQMKWGLAEEYDIDLAENRADALESCKEHRQAVALLDLGLPPHPGEPTEGLAALAELLAVDPNVKVIIITGQSERQVAINSVGQGAFGFIAKPVDIAELKVSLKHAFYLSELEQDYRELQRAIKADLFEHMLGSSPQMRDVFASIRKVAGTEAPVLILGESGTGKEMAALAIHRRSARNAGPFIAINCGAIPENLLESELFGHEKARLPARMRNVRDVLNQRPAGRCSWTRSANCH